MAFFDKLNQVAKNIGDKTNDAIETTKLNSKITAEQNAAGEALKKIGEYYYTRYVSEGTAAPEILEFCLTARQHYDAVAAAQAEIERIKLENAAPAPTAAPMPTAPISAAPLTPTPAAAPPTRVCPVCQNQVAAGVKFCPQCGNKFE